MKREEYELHQVDLAIEVIDNKLKRITQDRERLLQRRSILVARRNGEHQPPIEGWDCT